MAEKINPSAYKQFLTMVRQAKQSGSSELRLPIKMVDEIIMELNEVFFDRINFNNTILEQVNNMPTGTTISSGSFNSDNNQVIISGGTFK